MCVSLYMYDPDQGPPSLVNKVCTKLYSRSDASRAGVNLVPVHICKVQCFQQGRAKNVVNIKEGVVHNRLCTCKLVLPLQALVATIHNFSKLILLSVPKVFAQLSSARDSILH